MTASASPRPITRFRQFQLMAEQAKESLVLLPVTPAEMCAQAPDLFKVGHQHKPSITIAWGGR